MDIVIAVCDDNTVERHYFCSRIEELAEERSLEVRVDQYANGKNMLFQLDDLSNAPHIIYLDINMPDMSGVEVAFILRERGYKGEIVFLTRSNLHWLDAFDAHAFHYIVKGDCSENKFASIFDSLIQKVLESSREYMVFTRCGKVLTIAVPDIYYFEVLKKLVTVHYKDGEFEFYSTMGKIEDQLLDRNFVRVHKSYLVSLFQIAQLTRDEVILTDDTRIPFGRTYQKDVRELLHNKMATIISTGR